MFPPKMIVAKKVMVKKRDFVFMVFS